MKKLFFFLYVLMFNSLFSESQEFELTEDLYFHNFKDIKEFVDFRLIAITNYLEYNTENHKFIHDTYILDGNRDYYLYGYERGLQRAFQMISFELNHFE